MLLWGIPDSVPKEIFNLVPSYQLIAIAILKNDVTLKSLGYEPPKSKAYSELKRIEISKRQAANAKINKQDKDHKRAERRVNQLTPILQYLEMNPSREYIEKELARQREILIHIYDGYDRWRSNNMNDFNATDNPRGKYESLMRVPDIRRWIRNAEMILSGHL